MGEANRRKKREDEFAKREWEASYAPGLTLLGAHAHDAEDHADIVADVVDILSVPSAMASETERREAIAQVEASVFSVPGTYLWDLTGKAIRVGANEPDTPDFREPLPSVRLYLGGEPRPLTASFANGGPGVDRSLLRGMLRLTARGKPFASCDMPLCIQAGALADAMDATAGGPDEPVSHLQHLVALNDVTDGPRHDGARADREAAGRILPMIAEDGAPPELIAASIDLAAQTIEAISTSAIRDLAGPIPMPIGAWSRIDDDMAGFDWEIALRQFPSLGETPVPGPGAMMVQGSVNSATATEVRRVLSAGAELISEKGTTKLFRRPDGRLAFLDEEDGDVVLVIWEPTEGSGDIADRFLTQRLMGGEVDPRRQPRVDISAPWPYADLAIHRFLPIGALMRDFSALALMLAHQEGATLHDLIASLAAVASRPDRPTPPEGTEPDVLATWRERVSIREDEAKALAAMAKGEPREELTSLLWYLRDALDDAEDDLLGSGTGNHWPELPDLELEGRLLVEAASAGGTLSHLALLGPQDAGLRAQFDWISPRSPSQASS